LFDIGPSEVITYLEIQAWQQCTGVELSAWEAQALHTLSLEYLNQQHESRDADCPAPYMPENMTQKNRKAVANQLKTFTEVFKLAGKK